MAPKNLIIDTDPGIGRFQKAEHVIKAATVVF